MSLIPIMTPQMRQTLTQILNSHLPDWSNLDQQARKAIDNQQPFARAPWEETDVFRKPIKGIDHDMWQIEDGICLQKHPTIFERILGLLMGLVNILLAPLRAIQKKIEEMIFSLSSKLGHIGGILCIPLAILLMVIDFFRDYLAGILRSITNPFMLLIKIISFPIWLVKTIFSRIIETLMAPLLSKIIAQMQKGQQAIIGFLAKYGWLRGVLLGMIRDRIRLSQTVVIPKKAVSEIRLVRKWSFFGTKTFLIVVEGDKLKEGFIEYLTLKLKQIFFPYYWERTVHVFMLSPKIAEQAKSAIEDALIYDDLEDKTVEVSDQEIPKHPRPEVAEANVTVLENHCPQCNKSYNLKNKFCTKCGSPLVAGSAAVADPDMTTQTTPEDMQSESSVRGAKFNKSNIVIALIAAVLILAVGFFGYKYLLVKQNQTGKTGLSTNKTVRSPELPVPEKSEPIALNVAPQTDNKDVSSPQVPASWTIAVDKLFTREGVPLNKNITKLLTALESPKGEGVPVSKREFMDMLSRPEAKIIYYKEIMKYATPTSKEIQKKEHEDYTQIFMREVYQKAGLEFLRTQSTYLARAEREYGVLQRDIVSVLIWESGLGKFTGDYQEFNVFLGQILFLDQAQEIAVQNILAEGKPNPLDDPTHAAKERKRLERRKAQSVENMAALLRFSKKTGLDPFDMKGSWGGAIGSVQFMPANLKYAVDGDGDGKLNLSQWPDAIMSAGNFLKIRGRYDTTEAGRRRALLRYNPSSEYVDGVILLAETIWKRHLNGE